MNEIFARTSVRQFEAREVEPEKIEKILRAAMAAPSATNQQPWEFCVVTDKEMLERIGHVTPYATPAAKSAASIVVCYRTEGLRVPVMAHIDCAIATENIWLECEALGLGGVMLGIAPFQDKMDALAQILQLPPTLMPFTIFALGYPVKKRAQTDRFDATRVHYIK